MRLYLLRHGPAGLRSAWHGDDRDRPLTRDGARKVKRMAATLAAEGVEPDLIVTSPLSRAAGTAAIVAKALRCRDSVLVDSLLEPGFDLEALVKLIEAHHDANSLLLVGHEPDLSKVAAALGCARIKLQKGGVVEFDVPQSELDQAVLIRLTQPT